MNNRITADISFLIQSGANSNALPTAAFQPTQQILPVHKQDV